MISQETIIQVREQAQIFDVVSKFLNLKKSGSSYKAISPFTNERTPSFFVNPQKNFWKDFSSGKGGDAISFLIEHERMTYPEAVLWMCDLLKIKPILDQNAKGDEREVLHRDLSNAAKLSWDYFQSQWYTGLPGVHEAITDITARGFSQEEVMKFKIGVCPNDWDGLARGLDIAQRSHEPYLALGTIKIGKENKIYSTFRNRVVFPIISITGKIVGFTGRFIGDAPKEVPKYLHLQGSVLFEKSNHVYGLFWSKKKIMEMDKCYLVEGPMDYHAMVRSQMYNVGATLGTSITANQVRNVKRFTNNIVVMYDSDKGGITGAIAATKICLQEAIMPSYVFLPSGEDPDSIIRTKGVHVLQQILLREDDCASAIIRMSEYNQNAPLSTQQKSIRSMAEIIAASPYTDIRTILAQAIGNRVGMDHSVLLEGAQKVKPNTQDPADRMVELDMPLEKSDRTMLEEKLAMIIKYQYNAMCYHKSEGKWEQSEVYHCVSDWCTGLGVEFKDNRFTGLVKYLHENGHKPEIAQSVIFGLPGIVEYGFYERSPKELFGTCLKIILDLAFMDAQEMISKGEPNNQDDVWMQEMVELQEIASGLYDEMKSIPS